MTQNKPLLALSDITKVYRMGDVEVNALKGVSLILFDGEFVAVMGSSGSGKSTLMNVIGCLDRPSSGGYELAGRAVSSLSRASLAEVRNKTIGFVFQSFNLLSRTSALENVELPLLYSGAGARERRRKAREALALVGLADRMHHHPNQMSGGQQQRVAIARAIVTGPRLILADEPTGNLDSRTSVEIMALFQNLNAKGMTVMLVTHEPDIASFAGRVVVVKDGMILSDVAQSAKRAEPEVQTDAVAPSQAEGKGGS